MVFMIHLKSYLKDDKYIYIVIVKEKKLNMTNYIFSFKNSYIL